MATEEEAREATDGKEVQVEAVDLGTVQMLMHPEGKLSSTMEIKSMGEIFDSTEGTLKIPEDQVLVEVPSEVKLPTEHNLNGTTSSLNGHMDKEEKVSNEQLHDNNQEEAELDETSTDQNNRINKEEVTDCVSHGESTTEDSCLLKHQKEEPKGEGRQDLEGVTVDDDKVQEDTLKTENAVERIVDGQQDQNLEPAKATEDIQPASMANTPDVVVVAEAPAGVQTPVEPNLDDSDAIPDDIDGNTEIDEPAKEDGFIHLDHKESIPEDTSIAEYTDEAVKVEYQLSKQGDVMDAEVVQEEIPKCEETDVQEEMPKPEHADESTTAAQEMLNQESAEETNGLVNEKTVATAHQSNIAASEPQVAEIAEELKDIETIETQEIIQQGHVTPSKEPSAEDDSTASEPNYVIQQTLEQDPVEVKDTETHHGRTISASEDTVEDNVTAEGPTYDIEEVENVESTEEIKENITENIAEVSNVAIVYEVDEEKNVLRAEDISEKHMRGLEPEETKNTEPVETEEVSDQRQAALLNDSAQKHNTPPSEKQQMESAIEMKETEATKTEAIPQESNACVFEEPSTEDYITESETNCDTQEVSITESSEVIEGDKDIKTGEISDQSIIVFAEESAQENNAPENEPTADIQLVQEPESEDLKNTKLVEVNKTSHEMNATVFQTPTQEDNPTTIELHAMESAGEVSNTEATEAEGTPHQSNADQSEERSTEENNTASEPQILEPESVEETNDIEATEPQSISQQSIISTSEESVPEETTTEDNRTTEPDVDHQLQDQESAQFMEIEALADHAVQDKIQPSEPTADIQPVQELEQTETKSTGTCEMDEASDQTHAVVFNDLAQVDGIAASEPQVTEIAKEQKDIEATETQEITQHGHVTPSKEVPAEDAVKDTETPREKTICTSEEDTVEDNVTAEGLTCDSHKVDNVESTEETKENIAESIAEVSNVAIVDTQEVNITESSEVIEGDKDIKTGEISDQSIIVLDGESAQENNVPESEPTADIQLVQKPESEDLKNTKLVEVNKTSHEMNATVFQTPTQEDNPTTIELHAMESAGEVSNTEATEAEGTPHQSNADQSEERSTEENNTASEPQILEPESVEETNDIEATEPQSISQQSIISTSEESVPEETATEDNRTTEPDVDHQLQDQESAQFMEIELLADHAVQDKIQPSEPTADIQPVQELEQTETKSTGTCEMDEASDQTHAVVFNDLAQEDGIAASEPQVTEIAKEQKDIEATETQEITQHGHVTPSKELPAEDAVKDTETPHEKTICTSEEDTVEDNVTAEGPTCDSHKVDNVESTEETKENIAESIAEVSNVVIVDTQEVNITESSEVIEGDKDIKTGEISDQSIIVLAGESAQENNVPESEPTVDIQLVQKPESEDLKNTKLVEVNKTSHEMNATVFQTPTQEDNPTTIELHAMESAEVSNTEATEAEGTPHQSNADQSEERSTEENNTASEPQILEPESVEETNDIEATKPQSISQQSIISTFKKSVPEEIATENNITTEPEVDHQLRDQESAQFMEIEALAEHAVQDKIQPSEPTADIQPVQELEQTETKSTQSCEMDESSDQTHAVVFNDLAQEDGIAASEPQVTQIAEEQKDIEATETQEITQHGHVTPSKEVPAEDAVKDTETPREKTICTSEEDTVEDNVTAEGLTCDSHKVDNVESTEETKENIAESIAEVSNVAIVDKANEEKNVLRAEDISEKHTRGIEPEETKNTEPVETEEDSDRRHAALFDDSAQEDNTPASEKQHMESALEIKEIEASKMEAIPQETNACVSEEPSPEDNITESETTCDTQEVNITESSKAIGGDKDTETEEVSDQSNMDFAGESTQENNVPKSEPTADIESVQEAESEEMKNTELVEGNETSHEMNAAVFQKPTQEDNPTTSELHVTESAGEVNNIEATEAQATPHQSNSDQSEEQATEENKTASETQILEAESVKEMNDTEASEPQSISQQSIITTSEKSVSEEIAKEDTVTIEPNVDHPQIQDQESAEFKEIEAPLGANKPQGITSSCIVSTSEESTSEDNATATETSSDTQAENLQSSEVTEDTENAKIAEEVAPEEHVETEDTADISPVQEPEEETKDTEPVGTEDNMTSRDLPAEEMVMETMETEAIPHESPVASIKELTEYDILTANAPHVDIQPVLELESVEAAKCTDTTEHPGELQKIIGSASDKLTPTEEKITVTESAFDTQQVQNLTSQEIKDSEDAKTDEISDLSSFPTLEEADQESNVPRIEPTSDVQQVQELDPKEETRGIEAVETEDHQQYRVSTLEEPAVDSEPNVDDQQMHEDKPAEVKDNEAMEAEEAIKQSNISTPDNAAEERSELGSDLEFYVQPAQQVELSRDSEDSELVKAEETSGQSNIAALEETTTEDSVVIEINPPVDIKQEHEQESVEEIKCIDATEAKEDFHTSQADAIEKLASESNIATIEPSYDIQLVNDLERNKEMKGIQAMDDGEQTDIATLEDPSTTDNGTKPEEHPVELNEHNMGNETDNEMLVHGIKDEIQTSTELKDTECDLGETVLTPLKSENTTDKDDVQSSSDDTLETPKDIHQVKEEQKAGTEHNSSQMSQHGENITHVQDRDIKGEFLTQKGTAEASQALFESDPQVAQEVTEKDDTIKGDEQTNDHDNRQLGVVLQLQSCETDALSIVKQDEAAQKVDLDQQQKEDEIESQKEELQVDEQKHEEKTDDFATEPLVEPQNIENGTTNRTEDTDAFKAEQTEADITEILRHEQAPHISEESTPSITYMKVENVKGTDEGAEEDADAKNDSKDEQQNAEKDKVVAKDSTDEKDETTDENTNDELEPGLASSVQEISDPAPSNDEILKKDHIAVPQNVESGVHREDKECTNKVNDDVHAIQTSDKEIIDEVEENKEMQNEDNDVHHDESQTKPEEKESPQLRFNQPYNTDTKIDNTTTPWEEIIHDNTSIQPREIEEIGENKGIDSISTPFVETSIQNNVEQDLSSHQKLEDEKLSTTEQNAVDIEAMEEKVDESASDTNQTRQCKEDINADDVLQLETEENAFDKIDETALNKKTETSNTTSTEAVKINEDITDKASGADGALSDESLKTFNDTGRDLDVSSVITASKEESMNENMEDHKLPLPAQVEKETEREMSLSEKLLHDEPEEQDENQTPNEQDDDGIQETEIGDAKKEVEQELPVSHFLMNLILGKENGDANGNSESEAERKQEETTEDNSCLIISRQDESLVSLPTENKVDDKFTFKQEKHDVKCSEEKQEMVKEQSHDLKLDTERSIETDEELNKNTRDLETPAYQDNSQDEISGEMFSEEAASIATKMETRDIEISNIELDDSVVDTICQENSEASTTVENGSSTNNLNNLTNTKASEEDTLGEGQTGLLREFLPKEISADAVSEQALLLTESGMTDAKDLPSDAESIRNPVCAKQDEPTESSNIEATSTPDIQLESEEVDKKEEKQHASTATCEVSKEHVESLHDSLQKSTSSEATSDEKEPQITKPVSDTEMTLACEKEISEGSTCMNEKEKSNFSIEGQENFQTEVEAQANGPKIQINHDKQDEAAENETAMEPERLGESNFQEHQESGTEQKSPKESDEGDQQFLVKKETMIKQEDVHETVESHTQTLSITSNEEQEMLESKVQERDLNMISPKEAPDAEEKFVDITKPEFSTDEAMKTEARGAGQKVAHKKHNLLSGVGSKVKHQLAKVKKAIIGKPGQTKPESLKS
ncbi:uncharacterized protein LOC133918305 [Phragmites australis]|uniref:uncharacterized protein LOC133918305 n=1 Tax=Phragmites australis TaxID=29695 RepID=UPI002D774BD3|nr:uncharacterized protein LOC133918305 [Phragmites australis]